MATIETTTKQDLRQEMLDQLKSYERAFRDLDASKVISHYHAAPEFKMVNDGKVLSFRDLEKEVRSLFTNMTKFEGGYDNPQITVISDNMVTATMSFRECLTFFGGEVFNIYGEVTWIAKKMDHKLKFIYGHAFHKHH